MASKEFIKPQVYYLIRRKWFDQLCKFCDNINQKKGNDPFATFWKAFGLGMLGRIDDCLTALDRFQSRRDFHYPVTIAKIYFHKKAPKVDKEAIKILKNELSAAEDVTVNYFHLFCVIIVQKEAGLALAARFFLYTGSFDEAAKISKKLFPGGNDSGGPSSAFEMEGAAVEQWSAIGELEMMDVLAVEHKRQLQAMDASFRGTKANPISIDQHDVDALMLWVKVRQMLNYNNEAINILNQIIAMHPSFLPALSDKTLLLATSGEWEQALDSAQRLLDIDNINLDALQVIAVHAFTQDSQSDDACQKLEDYFHAVQSLEPSSVEYTVQSANLFACICSRKSRALELCCANVERLKKSVTSNAQEAQVHCAVGQLQLMLGTGRIEAATKSFTVATKKDMQSIDAMQGLVLCQLQEGALEDAAAQLELLHSMHAPEELGYMIHYLQSLLLRGKRDSRKAHVMALNQCLDIFQSGFWNDHSDIVNNPGFQHRKKFYLGAFFNLVSCNPDFSMLLAIDYLTHLDAATNMTFSSNANSLKSQLANMDSGDNPVPVAEASSSSNGGDPNMTEISAPVQCGLDILLSILKMCPGMVCAYLELSRCYCSLGIYEEAARTLQQSLALQPNNSQILVAMAKVEVTRQKFTAADRLLEQALSCDFNIRSFSLFRLVKVQVRAQQNRLEEALNEAELLLGSVDFKFSLSNITGDAATAAMVTDVALEMAQQNAAGKGLYSDLLRLTDEDRVAAFVAYASLLSRMRRMKEAHKVLSHAKVLFAGTAQEVQVLVAASQLFIEKGDFDAAIRMLDKISDESPTYARAQMIKADILLTNNHDKEGFVKCYQVLAEKEPTAKHFALLGDAYLRILNPELAIEALHKAFKLDSSNEQLRARIGRALVATHEFHRAVDFYESAIREANKARKNVGAITTDVVVLSHDLAKLYIKLDRSEGAIRALNAVLHDPSVPRDVTSLRQDVTTLLLLVKVQTQIGSHEVLQTLLSAYTLQKELLLKLRSGNAAVSSSSEILEHEKYRLSDICEKIGFGNLEMGENQQAEANFQEAVQQNPQNITAMFGIAKIAFQRNERELCQTQCQKIITANPLAENAAIMLSDVISVSEDPDSAAAPLENLLKLKPNNYAVLENLITLLRRVGKLSDAQPYLQQIERYDRRCLTHAGYHYCQGLYARYTNDVAKAITEFNQARKDEVWGAGALTHMIELYLNPDQEGIWDEKGSGPLDDATRAHITAAEHLLGELRPRAKDPLRVKVLENYCAMATRHKPNVDRAMQSFSEILDKDQDYLPAVLGMATGFMIESNQHKARNLLKRIGKMEATNHDGEDFEKANLLLAKFYIDKGKNDNAQDICKKTLQENKSCSQAWEILGLIFEKDGNYDSAANAYEQVQLIILIYCVTGCVQAWKLEFEASASVGFKLAFNYLKCRKYVNAIDVCEVVLRQYPDYPRIADEILKKAQLSIRTAN